MLEQLPPTSSIHVIHPGEVSWKNANTKQSPVHKSSSRRMTEGLLAPTGRSADLIRAIDAPFDAQDPDHLEACRQLWHTAWPEVEYAGLVHGGWTRLGFPTGDLVKDLTAISLVHHLLNLAKFAPAVFASALEADAPLSTASAAVCLD